MEITTSVVVPSSTPLNKPWLPWIVIGKSCVVLSLVQFEDELLVTSMVLPLVAVVPLFSSATAWS